MACIIESETEVQHQQCFYIFYTFSRWIRHCLYFETKTWSNVLNMYRVSIEYGNRISIVWSINWALKKEWLNSTTEFLSVSCFLSAVESATCHSKGSEHTVKVTSLKVLRHFTFPPVTHLDVYTCRKTCSFLTYLPAPSFSVSLSPPDSSRRAPGYHIVWYASYSEAPLRV